MIEPSSGSISFSQQAQFFYDCLYFHGSNILHFSCLVATFEKFLEIISSYGVFFLVFEFLFGKCIDFHLCRVHSAKFGNAGTVTSLLNMTTRVTCEKYATRVPGCSGCIDSETVLVPGIILPSIDVLVCSIVEYFYELC